MRPQAIPQLKETFPIERARMQLRIQVPAAVQEELHDHLTKRGAAIKSADFIADSYQVTVQVPSTCPPASSTSSLQLGTRAAAGHLHCCARVLDLAQHAHQHITLFVHCA
jgi:ribosome maturation protein Sdo1